MDFRPHDAYIYFVQDGEAGPVKIGLAADVMRRFDQLASSTHRDLFVRAVILGNGRLEKELHARFAADRIRGEWYHPSVQITAFINSVPTTLLRDLKYRRRQGARRTPLADARKVWADKTLTYKQAQDLLVGWTQARISELLGPRGVDQRKGHDPKKAREFGSRGGRPRKDRGISDADAEKHWFDMRHSTNDDALKHMGTWTENAAWRKFGASGRQTGPRRPLPAKRKRRS